ncbi:hypothetical protein IEQ34_013540 [Dendrobium chrysotoxum]|uniref:Photosystem I assembly protein Ycf4 n=1 Tax=Dendrobium chrysotoxum TaxID=161865 RepID=A0AAV7GSL1_DENCH|nr:hypothetical protein IEQ34_013540 [Dendrobium chrysotoxum]
MSIIIGLIVFFRDCGAVLSIEYLSWIDPNGWIFALEIHQRAGLVVSSSCRNIRIYWKNEES